MKIVTVTVLLIAFVCYSESAPIRAKRDVKSDLLERADRILELVSAEVQILNDAGRDIEVKGLIRIETRLIQLELLLKTSNDTQEVQRLEAELRELEGHVAEELAWLGKDFVSNDEKARLVEKAQAIVGNATAEVKRLKAENKTLLAEGIERELVQLINLELDLKAAKKSENIRLYAELLIQAERRIEGILKDIHGTKRLKRQTDLRQQLLTRADQLIARANAEITALRAQNRTADVALLQQEVRTVQQLAQQLRQATNQNTIRAIEQRLNESENRLDAELRRLGVNTVNTTERDAIIKRAEDLLARANAEVVALRAEGRNLLATELQFEEAVISELVRELRAATQSATIRQLEQRLVQAENNLDNHLRNITHVTSDPEKDALIKRADAVVNSTNVEINKLKAAGRTQDAHLLEVEEKLIAELVNELKRTTDAVEVKRVKTELNSTLSEVEATIKAFEGQVTSDPERDALIKRADDLKKRAETQGYKQKAEGKELDGNLLLVYAKLIDALVKQLINTHTDADAAAETKRSLKELLDTAEPEVKKYENMISDLERDALVKRADELKRTVNTLLNKLRGEGKTAEATDLENRQKSVDDLVNKAKSANATQLTQIKAQLKDALDKLDEQIRNLQQPLTAEEIKESLIERGEELDARIKDAIVRLKNDGKESETTELQRQEKAVASLVDEIQKTIDAAKIQSLIPKVEEAENALNRELERLEIPLIDETAVDELLKKAEDLALKAKSAILVLREQGKEIEAEGLQQEVESLIVVDVLLRSATTPEEVKLLTQTLTLIENRVTQELSQIRVKRDVKEDLLKTANELLNKADQVIMILQQSNRMQDADLIKSLAANIRNITAQLNNATTDAEIIRIEERLGIAEGRLFLALDRVGQQADFNEIRDGLIVYADELILVTNQAILKFRKDNNTNAVQLLETDEKRIQSLVSRLRNATITLDIFELEQMLVMAELELQSDLRKLGYSWDVDVAKGFLLQEANILTNRIKTRISLLKQRGDNQSVAGLELELSRIQELVTVLNNTKDPDMISNVEFSLLQVEIRVQEELAILGEESISRKEREALIAEIEGLAMRALIAARKLREQGRDAEAQGLIAEEILLVEMEVAVRNAIHPGDLVYLERRLRQIEARLLNSLQMLGAL